MVKIVKHTFFLLLICLLSLSPIQASRNRVIYHLSVFHTASSTNTKNIIINIVFGKRINNQSINISTKDINILFKSDILCAKNLKSAYNRFKKIKAYQSDIILFNNDKFLLKLINDNPYLRGKIAIIFSDIIYSYWKKIRFLPCITGLQDKSNGQINIDITKCLLNKATILLFYKKNILYDIPKHLSHAACAIITISLILLLITISFILICIYHKKRNGRKKALIGLKEQNNFLQLALSGSKVYVWRMENHLFAIENSPYAKDSSDYQVYTLDEVLETIHPDDRVLFKETVEDVYNRKKHNAIIQCRFSFASSDYSWWEVRCTQGTSKPYNSNYIVGLLVNIQSFKKKEQQLMELQEKAEEANKMKSIFLANMSHEIRTPLNAIVGFSNLIADEDLTPEDKKQFKDAINKNTNMLLNLVNDILEFSRIESEKMIFNMEHLKLNTLLEEIYQTQKLLMPESIEFIKDFSPLSIIIYVDRNRFTELISNLINNAIKFTETGFIKLSDHYDKKSNSISIQVHDTGIGISEEKCDNIFERFYKGNEFAQGTGLGLAICRNITEKMNGKISVTSKVGEGSCFTITFPCTIVNTTI